MIERISRDLRFRRLRADPEYNVPVNSVSDIATSLINRWGNDNNPTPRRNVAGIAIPVAASIGARATLSKTAENLSRTFVLAPLGAAAGRLALEATVYRPQTAHRTDARVSHTRGILAFIANAAEKKVSGWILGLEGRNNSRDRSHHLLDNTQAYNPTTPNEVKVISAPGTVSYQPIQRNEGLSRPNADMVIATRRMREIMANREDTEAYAKEAIHYAITTGVLRMQGSERRENTFGAGNLTIKRQRLLDIAQQMIAYHAEENIWTAHLEYGIANPAVYAVFQEAQDRYDLALDAAPHNLAAAKTIRKNYINTQIAAAPTPAEKRALRASRAALNRDLRTNQVADQRAMLLRIKRDLMEREQLARTTQTAAFTAIAALKTIPMKILLIDPLVSTIGRIGNLFGGLPSSLDKPDIFGIWKSGGGSHNTLKTTLPHSHHAGISSNSASGHENGHSTLKRIFRKPNTGITINNNGNNDTIIVNGSGRGGVESLVPGQSLQTPVQPKVTESFYVFDAHDPHPTTNHLPADGNTSAYKQWVAGEARKSMNLKLHAILTSDQKAELKAREAFIITAARKLNPDLIHANSISHEGVITVEAPAVDIHDAATIDQMTAVLHDKATQPIALQKEFWNNWKTQSNQPFDVIATDKPLAQNVFDATTQLNGPRLTLTPPPFFNHIDVNAATNIPQITDFTPYMPDAFKHFMAQNGLTNFQALLSRCDTLPYDQKMKAMNYIRMTMYHTPHNLQSQLKLLLEKMTVSVPVAT